MEITTDKTNNPASMLADELRREAEAARKFLERVPEDKFDWKPHEKSMTFIQLAAHCAEMFGWIRAAITTSELDFAQNPFQPFQPQTNAELLEYFDRQIKEATESLDGATDETLAETWTMRNGEQIYFSKPKIQILRADVFNHIIHHRGQLSVYLRLNDIPVPGIYGPSADDAR